MSFNTLETFFKSESIQYFNEELQTANWWYAQEFTDLEFCYQVSSIEE